MSVEPWDGETERRRWPRVPAREPMSRKMLARLLAAAWIAVMAPLGAVLWYAYRADERAERSGRTVCELTETVGHLADTLDAGLAVLVSEDPDTARTELSRTVTEGRAQAQLARDECRP